MKSRDYIQQKATVMGRTVEDLIPTYVVENDHNPIPSCEDVPSEAEVVQILNLLNDVFYPGYRSRCLRGEPIESMVIERLDEAYDLLFRQVKRALTLRQDHKYADPHTEPDPWDEGQRTAEAERVVGDFFARLPHIRNLLKQDVIAAYKGDPAARSYKEVILSYPGLRAITTHRVAHELYRLGVPLIPRLMNEYIHARTGIDIHPGAQIGERFFIDHGTGVVIGETTIIGNGVRIYHGVTLGARSVKVDEQGAPLQSGKRHPTIEDDVIIYPGATILGDIVIGHGAIIGGNVWILKAVPPHTMVMLTRENYTLRHTE